MRNRLVMALAAMALAGCANMLSIHREDVVTPAADAPGARLVLIDAKQRAITSVARPSKPRDGQNGPTYRTVVCAEPSPDALQALAASNAITVSDSDQRQAKIAQVIQETAASIGLRTQSIQLLRDAMFRICEAYQSQALDDNEVMALHRRYQNLMLGLLAIEQLTGATKAGQVALVNAGSASAGAAAGDLAAAEKRVVDARQELADADERATNKQDIAAATGKEIAAATQAVKAEADATKKAALQRDLDTLVARKKTEDAAVTNAEARRNIQADVVRSAVDTLTATRGRVAASAEGNAKIFEGMTVRGALDSQSTTAIATAAHLIVKEVVNSSFLYEACFLHLDRLLKSENRSALEDTVVVSLLDVCFSGIDNAADRLAKAAQGPATAPATPTTPARTSSVPAPGTTANPSGSSTARPSEASTPPTVAVQPKSAAARRIQDALRSQRSQ